MLYYLTFLSQFNCNKFLSLVFFLFFLYFQEFYVTMILFNRPGVSGAVLRHSLINPFIHLLVQISSKHCQSRTGGARELKLWENVHPTLCVMCHKSHVTCHVSPVTFQVSHVTCHVKTYFFLLLFYSKKKLNKKMLFFSF